MLGTTINTGKARAAAEVGSLAGVRWSVSGSTEFAASPRIWEVGAPGHRVFAGDRLFGATESSPREGGMMPALKRIDAVGVSLPGMEDASIAGLWGPRGTSRSLKTRRAGRAAHGRCSVKGLTHSDRSAVGGPGQEEGVPCHRIVISAERMCHDVVRTPGSHREGVSRSLLGPVVMCD